MIIPLFIAGLCLVPSTLAGCVEDLAKDGDYVNCFLGFSSYLTKNMDPSDPSSTMSVMCSNAGKMKLKCVTMYMQQCPDLMTQGGADPSMGSVYQMVGNIDAMCAMMGVVGTGDGSGAGSGTGGQGQECSLKVDECMKHLMTNPFRPDKPPPTPFSQIQVMVATLCGPLDIALKCMETLRGECPTTVTMTIASIMASTGEMGTIDPHSSNGPTLEKLNMFIDEECPSVPASFSTDACVKEQLLDQMFIQCVDNVAKNERIPQHSCESLRAGMKCVYSFVGKCGMKKADILVKSSVILIHGVPEDCPITSQYEDAPEGGANSLAVSIATVIFLSLLALI